MVLLWFLPILALQALVSASTYNYRKIGQFSISNPAFMKVVSSAGSSSSKTLLVTSFTGNPFKSGQVYSISNAENLVSNPASPKIEALPFKFSWPNFVEPVPDQVFGPNAVAVADGFLVPLKSTGGIYVLKSDGNGGTTRLTLSTPKSGWFYHNVTWIDLDQDGDLDVLTARANKPLIFGSPKGELLWLENQGDSYPWPEHVITEGPDVIIQTLNGMDDQSDYLDIVACQFFTSKLVLYRLKKSDLTVASSEVIDDSIGSVYAARQVDLDLDGKPELLVNNHEDMSFATRGIWAYEPPAADGGPWARSTVSDGYVIRESGQNQGTPGFVYPFHPLVNPPAQERPYILVAGDGSQEAYLLKPNSTKGQFGFDKEVIVNVGGVIGSIEISDIDSDGYVEFLVPNYDKSYVEVYTFKP